MERLTHKAHSALGWVWTTRDTQGAIDRLAAYEGTGLEPGEIKDLETQHSTEACESGYDCVELGKYRRLGDYDHLRELVEAEKDGRLGVQTYGRWEKPSDLRKKASLRCSECFGLTHAAYDYCPNCGAKMDGDVD